VLSVARCGHAAHAMPRLPSKLVPSPVCAFARVRVRVGAWVHGCVCASVGVRVCACARAACIRYVVKMHNVHQLCESKEVFTFVHPNTDETIDNRRYTSVEFEITKNAVIHGLAGFFDATLYGDVHISIDQRNFSAGMFSWFPLFFPLRWPAAVSAGDKISAHIWRQVALHKGRVWYEWMVDAAGVPSTIHNPTGRSYWIGL
jgi:hypothetical protein